MRVKGSTTADNIDKTKKEDAISELGSPVTESSLSAGLEPLAGDKRFQRLNKGVHASA